jgi:hypothetical protein
MSIISQKKKVIYNQKNLDNNQFVIEEIQPNFKVLSHITYVKNITKYILVEDFSFPQNTSTTQEFKMSLGNISLQTALSSKIYLKLNRDANITFCSNWNLESNYLYLYLRSGYIFSYEPDLFASVILYIKSPFSAIK